MTEQITELQGNRQNSQSQEQDSQCYGQDAWLLYQAGSLSESESLRMEEHLLSCESCLDLYLRTVEMRIQDEDISHLSAEFTARVMQVIEQENRWQKASVQVKNISDKKDKEARNRRANLLISYCAAAGIAMFFWVGGIFDGLSGSFVKGVEYLQPDKVVETKIQHSRGLIQTGWTEKMLVEEHPSFLKDLILKKE